jgi:hypothetical protein
LLEFRGGQVRVDWIKALLPLFQRILERAKWEDIGGRQGSFTKNLEILAGGALRFFAEAR